MQTVISIGWALPRVILPRVLAQDTDTRFLFFICFWQSCLTAVFYEVDRTAFVFSLCEVDRTARFLPLSLQINHLDEVLIAIPLHLFFSCMKLIELPLTAIPLHLFLLCMKLTELLVFLPLSLH